MRALHSVTEFSTEQGPAYIEAPKTNTFSLHHPFLVFFQNRKKNALIQNNNNARYTVTIVITTYPLLIGILAK
jgi:hypothetical protein